MKYAIIVLLALLAGCGKHPLAVPFKVRHECRTLFLAKAKPALAADLAAQRPDWITDVTTYTRRAGGTGDGHEDWIIQMYMHDSRGNKYSWKCWATTYQLDAEIEYTFTEAQ